MRIADRSVYIGPSLYAHFPVIRLEVDLGALEARLGLGPWIERISRRVSPNHTGESLSVQ